MKTHRRSRLERRGRTSLWAEGCLLLALTILTDMVPPRVRFGRWNQLLDVLSCGEELPVLSAPMRRPVSRGRPVVTLRAETPQLRCMLIAGGLDTGGIETVVAALALGLPAHGFDVEVVCEAGGRVERELRDHGVAVSIVPNEHLADHLAHRSPDVVALHRMDPELFAALRDTDAAVVPTFHAMESYLSCTVWRDLDSLLRTSPVSVAVSASVAAYFSSRTRAAPLVVENGVRAADDVSTDRSTARERLARGIGVDIDDDDVVVVALQRFSDQKNPAGLVDAFLLASERDRRLRLVVAGAVNSWLEVRRADFVRHRHPQGARVHFLGDSDPSAVLDAGDIFALASFSEGGPIAAVEAAAAGLPLVLTDVGFARELVAAVDSDAVVVPRPNPDFTQRSMARQRRRRHQANREAFAAALLRLAERSPQRSRSRVPEHFTEHAMIAGHAAALRAAVGTDSRIRPDASRAGSPFVSPSTDLSYSQRGSRPGAGKASSPVASAGTSTASGGM